MCPENTCSKSELFSQPFNHKTESYGDCELAGVHMEVQKTGNQEITSVLIGKNDIAVCIFVCYTDLPNSILHINAAYLHPSKFLQRQEPQSNEFAQVF